MLQCAECEARPASVCGSGDYRKTDLCVGCYYAWYQAKTRDEDRLKTSALRAEASQAPPRAAKAGEPGSTPVWSKGANVAVREKSCDQCGALITIRRASNGKHYPADRGVTTPHWRSCARAVTS